MGSVKSKLVSALAAFGLCVAGIFTAMPQANAVIYKSTTNWSRTDIGWGWSSSQYRQIFNAGDLDRNGYQDMMLTDRQGKLWLYPARNNTSFKPRKQVGWGWNNMRQIFGGIDYNGDAKIDILGIDYSGRLYYYPGTGTGYFAAKRLIGSGWGSVKNISATQKGYNGHPIIVGSANGILKAWHTNGKATINKVVTYGGGWDAMRLTAITGDVTGDGIPDMWVVSKTGELRLYKANNRTGTTFTTYMTGSGWAKVKYFLPRVDNAKTIRAIFPDGILRQYTLKSFTPSTRRYVPPPPPEPIIPDECFVFSLNEPRSALCEAKVAEHARWIAIKEQAAYDYRGGVPSGWIAISCGGADVMTLRMSKGFTEELARAYFVEHKCPSWNPYYEYGDDSGLTP